MENINKDYTRIKGWGVDADPKNDPTYPMKHRTNEEHKGYAWERPPLQSPHMEVLHSNERPNLTAVFGTSMPPTGLSGRIRRFAFQYGEGSYGHWLPLVLADRVNVAEGIIDDLRKGHVPNILAEKGMAAEWKYNRRALIGKMAIGTALAAATMLFLMSGNKKSR